MRNLLFCTPLRTALAGAGSKPSCRGVLMLLEICIAHIFCPPLNMRGERGGDAFRPDLARSLNVLGDCFAALDRRTEALDACEEAVRHIAPRFQAPAGGVRGSDGVQRAGLCDGVRTPRARAGRGVAGGGACGGAAAMSAVFRAVRNT